MAISTSALIDVNELKATLGGGYVTETKHDGTLEGVCNSVSDTIDRYLDRHVVSRGSITAYFSPHGSVCHLYTFEWPLISVTSVHETAERTYDSTTLLVENTGYVVSKPANGFGYITRTSNATSGPDAWLSGWRTVKAVYAAGYSSTTAVPAALKEVARRLGAVVFREWLRGAGGNVSQESDALGTMTRFSAAFLTADMKRDLAPFKRPPAWYEYEERVA